MASSLIMKWFVVFTRSSMVAFRRPTATMETIVPFCPTIATNPRPLSFMSCFSDLLDRTRHTLCEKVPQDGISSSIETHHALCTKAPEDSLSKRIETHDLLCTEAPQQGLSKSIETHHTLCSKAPQVSVSIRIERISEYLKRSNIDIPGIKKFEKTDEGLRIFLDLGFGNWDYLRAYTVRKTIGENNANVRWYFFYKNCSAVINLCSGYKHVETGVKDGGIVINLFKVKPKTDAVEEQKLS